MAYKLPLLNKIASSCPENLVFFRTEQLIQVARSSDDRYSEQARIACTTELLVRRFLNPYGVSDDVLDQIFPQKEWQNLEFLLRQDFLRPPTGENIKGDLWKASSAFAQRCEPVVRRRFVELLDRTDGFIPVYETGGTDAFFIPFHFEDAQGGSRIVDARNCPIEAWDSAVGDLFDSSHKCVVGCVQDKLPQKSNNDGLMSLDGRSFMLPVWMSVQRRNGKLPEYNRLRLFATGEIRDGRLSAVEVAEKLSGLRRFAPQAYLFFPDSSQFIAEDSAAVLLDTNCSLDEVCENILHQIELKGLVVPTLRDALARVHTLESEVRNDCFSQWPNMFNRVETYAKAVQEQKWRCPKEYLLCLMLKSVICCHNGETQRALAFNADAKKIAVEHGLERQLRLLEIEELVELQDQERFQQVLVLGTEMRPKLEKFADGDLLMRYHGTQGQAHCYGVLSGYEGFTKEEGWRHFDLACQFAVRLESEPDIAQDLNYQYLWHVLFEPGTEAANVSYRRAWDQIERNLHETPKAQERNRFFLERLRLMEVYRCLLAGKKIPSGAPGMRLPDKADSWLRALACKYLGAHAAEDGSRDEARELFREGRELLSDVHGDTVLAMIRMTISAEAYRSLGEKEFQERALDDLPSLQGIAAIWKWEQFLRGEGDFPGSSYWY